MGYQADSQTIRQRFDALWPTLQPDVPYIFGNMLYNPTKDRPWLRLNILPGDQSQVTMGNTRRFRRVGVVDVQLFVPAGDGDGESQVIADSVALVYQGQTIDGVIFRGTSLTKGGVDGPWQQYNVRTPYQADDII